jgi:hypothetical protein
MRSSGIALLLLSTSLSGPTLAQTGGHDLAAQPTAAAVAPSEAQRAFESLKSLAGSWVGSLTTTPPYPDVEGKFAQFSLRVTSRGNALVHELSLSGIPDHPVTVFYVDGERLVLTHYCDAGNRPRMAGQLSPDGKTLEFDFLDLSGGDQHGHMHHAVITFVDEDRHTEDWTFMMPGDKPVRAHFELQRTNFGSGATGR